jgi:SH3 domain protein
MRLGLFCFLLLLGGLASAETAYVTDNLRLGLHQAADTSDRSFRTLESGQEFEVLNRDRNYAQVELPDGVIGYVKAAYLVSVKPAKLIVAETEQRVVELEVQLEELNAAFAQPAVAIASLEQALAISNTELEKLQATNLVLADENAIYQTRHDQFKYSLPLSWVSLALGVCLSVGFVGGLWWFDSRSRNRHGGIRIY